MKITPEKKQDLHAIIGMIDSEFPYKGMTEKEMEKRLRDGKVFVFKTKVGKLGIHASHRANPWLSDSDK